MDKVCKRAPSSILCHNDKLYAILESIANQYNAPVWMMLWIMSKESWFWTLRHHTNKEDCKETTFNRHWSKANNTPNWTKRTTPVWPWCWLQKYDSLEEWFTSLARTIGIGYKWCLSLNDPATCMAYKYVWNPTVAESSWVDHVNSFR